MKVLQHFAAAMAACAALAVAPATVQARDCGCNPKPRPNLIRAEACLTDAEWAACPTKSWFADSKDHRFKTPKFRSQCGSVRRPYGHPNMSYLTSTGRQVVFRFGGS